MRTVDTMRVISTDGGGHAIGEVRRRDGNRVLLRFATGRDSYEDVWFYDDTGDAVEDRPLRLAAHTHVPHRRELDDLRERLGTHDLRIETNRANIEAILTEHRAIMAADRADINALRTELDSIKARLPATTQPPSTPPGPPSPTTGVR